MIKDQIEQQETTATGFTSFDFSFSQQKQRRVAEEQSKVSVAFVSTISQPKEPTLFDTLENDTRLQQMQAIDSKHLVDRRGKPTYLTTTQTKTLVALGCMLSKHEEDEEFRTHVKKINRKERSKTEYFFTVSITELTKLVSAEGTARKREKEKVIGDIMTIAERYQAQKYEYTDREGKEVRLTAPLIMLRNRIEDLSPDKELNMDYIEVALSPIFYYEYFTKYAIIKPQLFKIWNKAGSGTTTELFYELLNDLLEKYNAHRIAALQAEEKIRKSKKYKTEEGLYKAINKAQRAALTYREKSTTIRSRVSTDYESTRKQRADFRKHLEDAIRALKEYGLIREATYVTASTGEEAIDFVFNLDYHRNDASESLRIE